MSAISRMPVRRDDASAAFFDAAREGRFLLRRSAVGQFHAPSARFDPTTPTGELEWAEASGRGTLISWVVGRAKPDESGVQAVTALGGLIALAEGPWIIAPLECNDLAVLAAGIPVTATFPPPREGETIPVFVTS